MHYAQEIVADGTVCLVAVAVIVLDDVINSTEPSLGAFAAAATPMKVDAPGWLSTMTLPPVLLASSAATARAAASCWPRPRTEQ